MKSIARVAVRRHSVEHASELGIAYSEREIELFQVGWRRHCSR